MEMHAWGLLREQKGRDSIIPSYRGRRRQGAESLSTAGDDLTVSQIVIRCPSGKCVKGVPQVGPGMSKAWR